MEIAVESTSPAVLQAEKVLLLIFGGMYISTSGTRRHRAILFEEPGEAAHICSSFNA